MILKDWVMEPVVVKTVSYSSVSAVIVTCATGLVMNESFLHEDSKMYRDKITRPKLLFIAVKNNRSNRYYREATQSVAMLTLACTALSSSRSHASRVAPVVMTSSTTNTCLLRILSG